MGAAGDESDATREADEADTKTEPFVVASHRVLFETVERVACDACGEPLSIADASGEDDDAQVPGEGVYMWTRGDEVRFEKAPLCAACASAIGVTAMARWEIEEEEG